MKIPNRSDGGSLPNFPSAVFENETADQVRHLERMFAYHSIRLLLHARKFEWVNTYFSAIPALIAVIATMAIPAFVPRFVSYDVVLKWWSWGAVYLMYVAVWIPATVLLWPNLWIRRLHRKIVKAHRLRTKSLEMLLFAWSFIPAFLFAWAGLTYLGVPRQPEWLQVGVGAGLLGPAFFLSAMMIVMGIWRPFTSLVEHLRRSRYPDAMIAMACARVLANPIQRDVGRRRQYRQNIHALAYEELARTFSRDLPKLLRSGAPGSNAMVAAISKECAAAQRAAQHALYFEDDERLARFSTETRNTFIAALTRNWHLAPRSEPNRAEEQKRMISRVSSSIRHVVIALIPLAVLWILLRLQMVEDVPDSVMLLAYGWTVVTILGALDPALSNRVTLFKDTIGTIGGTGK